MKARTLPVLIACLVLSGCSYTYDVVAVLHNGVVQFTDRRSSFEQVVFGGRCVREVWVTANSGPVPTVAPGDNADIVARHRTYWSEAVAYEDDCANRMPLTYGAPLSGRPQRDNPLVPVSPKALMPDIVYDVSTTTGVTGYGHGRFVIRRDGRLENLPG
jgi:hypothetical protein